MLFAVEVPEQSIVLLLLWWNHMVASTKFSRRSLKGGSRHQGRSAAAINLTVNKESFLQHVNRLIESVRRDAALCPDDDS